ncbi:SH3 domain-containing protein [Allocoleopsis franciscana]|uniref:SH3 domain-containing protein n=1 Tax=Allocoleopsis franciscana PCC 7113 TaxID=1173027 RepID=K9WC75_9CYAN|nr:SH3 domain-containing protein [Allocoleopsis franciscana]AFZ17995.1 SH3 domain-containing protein [Allocoleopsis franciscana PCC 7113]
MKQMINWQKSVTIHTLLLSTLTAFVLPSTAATTATTQENPTPKITSFQNKGVYQIAQDSDKCHEVVARNGLYVREAPTVYSRALGILPYGQNVTVVESQGTNTVGGNPGAKWMPISAPMQGYVYAGYLSSCQESPAPTKCRAVSKRGGLYVRQEPSINSAGVGAVPNGRNVTLENLGANGWVPISAPLQGYVSAANLTYCP